MKKVKVAINGFGRIGRSIYRLGWNSPHIEWVGINGVTNTKMAAHLLKYDSLHGVFPESVSFNDKEMIIGSQKIPVCFYKKPDEIPFDDWGADVVLDCSGVFKTKEDLSLYFKRGVKKVLVSAPVGGADFKMVYGVNHDKYDSQKHHIVSNTSCTTNCLAPIAKVLHEKLGIQKGLITTVHSYTNDQRVLDSDHSDLRRARAAAVSMIPTTTGAAQSVGEIIPDLKGKIDGLAVRVPTPNVSLVDFVFNTEKSFSKEDVNGYLKEAAKTDLKGVLHCEEQPLVSVDFLGSSFSSVVDLPSTMTMGENMGKVLSWYDNEMGFSHRMLDVLKIL